VKICESTATGELSEEIPQFIPHIDEVLVIIIKIVNLVVIERHVR